MAKQDNQELILLFNLFDVDNSGTLTKEELKKLFQSPNPDGPSISEEKLAEYLKLADTDGSGDISVDEFVDFITNNVPQGAYGLKSLFRTIDINGDGSVEKGEFEQIKSNNKDLNQNVINIFDKKFQQDANSKVTYEQFVEGVNEYYKNLNAF